MYFPKPMKSMFKNSPSLIFCSDCGESNFKFEIVDEFETEFETEVENILRYESRARLGLVDENYPRSKISYNIVPSMYCTFSQGCPKYVQRVHILAFAFEFRILIFLNSKSSWNIDHQVLL